MVVFYNKSLLNEDFKMDFPLVHNYRSCSHFAEARYQFMMEASWDMAKKVITYTGGLSLFGYFLSQTLRGLDLLRFLPRELLLSLMALYPLAYRGAHFISVVSMDNANQACTKASKEFESFQAFADYQKKKYEETGEIFETHFSL